MTNPAIRYERVEDPTINIPIRRDDGRIELADIWREDILDPDPDDRAVYLVLDFADELKLIPTGDANDVRYGRTGSVMLELQAIDRDTREGIALPHRRIISPSVPLNPAANPPITDTGGRTYSTRPLTGLHHLPVSPRRDGN